jgi:hypothetical protein
MPALNSTGTLNTRPVAAARRLTRFQSDPLQGLRCQKKVRCSMSCWAAWTIRLADAVASFASSAVTLSSG